MIHGSKKVKKVRSQLELKEEAELSAKINSKLADFFAISRKEIKSQQIPKYLEFTSLLMQLCSDIPSIFNFRREIIKLALESQPDPSYKAGLYANQIKLTTKLIQSDPKSYTIWSYRQWLVLGLFPLNNEIANAQKQLCKVLLLKDEKNFHVWNYRNWVNSIEVKIDVELAFTQEKIKSNPFNFSPYHFRSKFFLQKYSQELTQQLPQEQRDQIIVYGMPKNVLDIEFENIRTAIFLNPSEQAPWLYYNWLLGQLVPALVVKREQKEEHSLLYFNIKVSDFSELIEGGPGFSLRGLSGKMNSEIWELTRTEGQFTVVSNLTRYSHVRLEYTGRLFLGQDIQKRNISTIKAIYLKEIEFLREVIESEQKICRFGWAQVVSIYKFILLCGTERQQWERIVGNAIDALNQLQAEPKNKKYRQKQLQYWQRLAVDQKLSPIEKSLKNIFG